MLILKRRVKQVGGHPVARYLPFREKRAVGPYVFVDQFGPTDLGPDRYMDVDQHPHMGLSTLTYLFAGIGEHRDSLGTVQRIGPGDVGFMTAGSGMTHTERTPEDLRGQIVASHGYQIWVALPADMEEMDPQFEFVPAEHLPKLSTPDVKITVVAGEAFGQRSPLHIFSPLFLVDIKVSGGQSLDIGSAVSGELGVIIDSGSYQYHDEMIEPDRMLILEDSAHAVIDIREDSRLIVLGGQPLPEEQFMNWNFVSSRKERLQKAVDDWQTKRFPKVPGDNTYIPYVL